MGTIELKLQLAGNDDFSYIYNLCDLTMRSYVEADLGNCFEQLARPTIQRLLQRGVFFKVIVDGLPVGAIAHERHDTHIQLEEIYVEPANQSRGLGTQVVGHLVSQSEAFNLPIRLHVLSSNPARAFYQRLGFAVVSSTPQVRYMQYTPRRSISDA